jgi:hypothetical protein
MTELAPLYLVVLLMVQSHDLSADDGLLQIHE